MQIKTATLLVASALFLGTCTYIGPAATSTNQTAPTTPPVVTVIVTDPIDIKGLNAELNATVDDGGAADLNQLQKDASGL